MAITKSLSTKIKFLFLGLIIGLVIGIVSCLFFTFHNPKDEVENITPSIVYERIISMNEMVTASQNYNITDRFGNSIKFFDMFDIPFTDKTIWYRYVGNIKAGVDLSSASFSQDGTTITVELNQPYIISNTPNMEKTGVLEERNNVFNPIHVGDVDELQKACIEESEKYVGEGGLMEESRTNAQQNLTDMFKAAFGDIYNIEFKWRE